MTHAEFANAVMDEWSLAPIGLRQTCCCQWYMYTARVDGKSKVIGKYTLIDSKPTFVLVKKDGTEKHLEVQE